MSKWSVWPSCARFVAVLTVMLSLSGCGAIDFGFDLSDLGFGSSDEDQDESKAMVQESRPTPRSDDTCPVFGALASAAQLTKLTPGAGTDLNQLEFEARIDGLRGQCGYANNRLAFDVQIAFSVRRGPANTEGGGLLRYFLALVGPEDQILWRDSLSHAFLFPEGRNFHQETRSISFPSIALSREGRELVGRARIVAGLLLTPSELEYNRQNPER